MDGHKSETWQAQRLAVRRSFFTRCRNMGSDLPPKLNGTFLLLTGNGNSLTALGLFSFLSFVAFLHTRRLSDSYPFCGFSFTAAPAACVVSIQCTYYRRRDI
jgi:hypothetical protein